MSDILLNDKIRTFAAKARPKGVFDLFAGSWPHVAPALQRPAVPQPDLLDALKPYFDYDLPLPDPFGPLRPYIQRKK